MLRKILEWDREFFIYLNSLGIEQYDGLWSLATNITTWIPLFILFLVLLLRAYPGRKGIVLSFSVVLLAIVVLLTTELTKEYIARLRPNNNADINTLIRILVSPQGYSFFSGHAASSFSITTLMVCYLHKKYPWAWAFFLWPLIFSFSRIYVGVHYPTDILVGALVGISLAVVFNKIFSGITVPYSGSGHPG